jgi:hypothetical protein
LELYKEEETRETESRINRKQDLMDHINKLKEINRNVQHENNEKMNLDEIEILKNAASIEKTFIAPVLITWINKHLKEEPIMIQAFGFLTKHLDSAEGCNLLFKHGIVDSLLNIHLFFKENPPIQLSIILALKQLLDCNHTRDDVVENVHVLHCCFSIAYFHMNSKSHVEHAVRCIAQCSRFEHCRIVILEKNYIPYFITFCNRFYKISSILRSVIKILNWISTNQSRIEYIVNQRAIQLSIKCIQKHSKNNELILPCLTLLLKCAPVYPFALGVIIKKNFVVDLISILQLAYYDDAIQIHAIKLIQIVAKTSVGWKQISDVKNGWQIICQGFFFFFFKLLLLLL